MARPQRRRRHRRVPGPLPLPLPSFPANPVVVSSRPKDPGPDPRKLAINAYTDLLLHMLPITNLGQTRPKIYTASRDQPTLKDHACCVAAVEAWLRKFDRARDEPPVGAAGAG